MSGFLSSWWQRKYWLIAGVLVPAVLAWLISQKQSVYYPPSLPKYQMLGTNSHNLVKQMQHYVWHWQFSSPQELYMPPVQQLLPDLDIQLHAIVVLKSGDGGAILSIHQGERQVLRLGEVSDGGIVLRAIGEHGVQVEESGKQRWIALQPSPQCTYLSEADEESSDIAKKLYFRACQ